MGENSEQTHRRPTVRLRASRKHDPALGQDHGRPSDGELRGISISDRIGKLTVVRRFSRLLRPNDSAKP
jgi:hypothetical protein